MTITAHDRTDLELAQAFAHAYRDADADVLRDVLAPGVRVRVLSPPGYEEFEGAEDLIAELRGFHEQWQVDEVDSLEVELLAANRMQTGRMARIVQRQRLRAAGADQTATMLVTHLIAIADGRIALVDELCSGIMPAAASY